MSSGSGGSKRVPPGWNASTSGEKNPSGSDIGARICGMARSASLRASSGTPPGQVIFVPTGTRTRTGPLPGITSRSSTISWVTTRLPSSCGATPSGRRGIQKTPTSLSCPGSTVTT